MRRAIGAAVVVMAIGGLMLAISEGSRAATPYVDAHALASALSTAGAGCDTVYPTRSVGRGDRVVCSVASGDVTIHTFTDSSVLRTLELPTLGSGITWVVGPNWFVATNDRSAATIVASVTNGDLVP